MNDYLPLGITDFDRVQHYLMEYGTHYEIRQEENGVVTIFRHDFEGKYNLESLAAKMKEISSSDELFGLLKTERLPDMVFETNFKVMPMHTNHLSPMIFGGALFSEMDLCAANCVSRFLYNSVCEGAVTHKANVTFTGPSYLGDIIYLRGEVVDLGKKSVVVNVTAHREPHRSRERYQIAHSEFVFISIEHARDVASKPGRLPYKDHGLRLKK